MEPPTDLWNGVNGSSCSSGNKRGSWNSPFTAIAKGNEGNADDEEDNEGDDAHLWSCEPTRHANHPNWSHFPLALG